MAIQLDSTDLPAEADSFVYVGNAGSNDLDVLRLDAETGALSSLERVALPTRPGGSTPMALSPDKRVLYVGIRSKPYTVAAYAIDKASGKLTHLGDGPLEDSMAYIFVDHSGRYLLGASYPGHKIAVNPIGPNGVVGATQQVIGDIPQAHAIQTDAANRFAFVPSVASDTVRLFRFDAATGTLSPNDPPVATFGSKDGPRHFVFHPNGRLLYQFCEISAALHVLDYDGGTGQMRPKQTVSCQIKDYVYNGGTWASGDIHITPDGRFVYTSERSTSTLAAFRVDQANGLVTLIAFYPTETQPRGFNIDPSGRYLLAAGQLSDHVAVHAIDQASGGLTFLKRYPMGRNPNWIEFVQW
jgi:6-phosphogluconolactonase